jgi:hypothetical protein
MAWKDKSIMTIFRSTSSDSWQGLYGGDVDVDAETSGFSRVALELTRAALGLADDFAKGIIASKSSNFAGPVSGIRMSYVKAH